MPADVPTTLVWKLRDEVSAAALKVDKTLKGVGVSAKGAGGMLTGLSSSLGGMITPTTAVAAGALALGGFLVDASKAAAEEQVNIDHLAAALKANVPAWQGGTAAVENQIAANENLAFSDDALRDSLASLVGSTHDTTKAFYLQKVAMDLARFKNVDLQTASEALIKVEGGKYKLLTSLGITLKDNATQTEALAAVEAVAAGQSDAYAKSTLGKIETLKIKMKDTEENIGASLVPIEAGLLDFVQRGLDGWGMLGDAITHATGNLTDFDKNQMAAEAQTRASSVGIKDDWYAVADAIHASSKQLTNLDDLLAAMDKRHGTQIREYAELGYVTQARPTNTRRTNRKKKGKTITKSKTTHTSQARAAGGPVWAGDTFTVGEDGPETLVMDPGGGGYVIPGADAPGGRSGAPVTIVLKLDGRTVAQVVDRHLYYGLAGAARTRTAV